MADVGEDGGSPYVIEPTTMTFEHEVLDRSREVPVVVDFWAAWCGPCRMLGPVLEKLAEEYAGRFILAKVDTEESPELAEQFGIRSIPAVYGIRDGQPVDGFVGVHSEQAIRGWLDRLIPSRAMLLAQEAAGIEAEDPERAAAIYREALLLEPDLALAQEGTARLAIARGDLEEAAAWVLEWEKKGFLEPEAERIKAELTLQQMAASAPNVDAARQAAARNPGDPGLKLALAEALAAGGKHDQALEIALDLVETQKNPIREQARKTMVAIFQLLPPESELLADYQRRLSFALSD